MKWIKDNEFIRGSIPMTKFNIRILTMAYLSIEEGDRFLDIGAGTGTISIEATLHGARAWAIEKELEGIEVIRDNCKKFNTKVDIIHGQAPDDLPLQSFNKCFIGGSGGKLKDIFSYLDDYLERNGILVGNFITLRNLNEFTQLLNEYHYENIELQLFQTSSMSSGGLLKGQNPIFIVKGVKK